MSSAGFYKLDVNGIDILGPAAPAWAYRPQYHSLYPYPCMGVIWADTEATAAAALGVENPNNGTGAGFYWVDLVSGALIFTANNKNFRLYASEHELYQQRGWDMPASGPNDPARVSMYLWHWMDDAGRAYGYWKPEEENDQWLPATRYERNPVMLVSNGGNIYACTQAGTSAPYGGGPQGTGTGIVDGNCVWDCVQIAYP